MYDMQHATIDRLTMKLVFVQKTPFSYFSYLYALCYKHHKSHHKNHHKNIIHSVLYCARVQKNKKNVGTDEWPGLDCIMKFSIRKGLHVRSTTLFIFGTWNGEKLFKDNQPPVETRLWISGTDWCKNSQVPATKKLSGPSLSLRWEVFQEGEPFQKIWFHCRIKSAPENMTFWNIYCKSIGK